MSLLESAKKHPVGAAIISTVGVLAAIGALWELFSDKPLIPTIGDALGDPVSLRMVWLALSLSVIAVAFWLGFAVLRHVRGIPVDLPVNVPAGPAPSVTPVPPTSHAPNPLDGPHQHQPARSLHATVSRAAA